jgi:hypothetical protein
VSELNGGRVQKIALEAESTASLPGVHGMNFRVPLLPGFLCHARCSHRNDSQLAGRSVEGVANQGVPNGGHVDAYLMSAAGFDPYIEQCKLSERGRDPLANFVVRHRCAASRAARGHAGTSHRIATDLAADGAAILARPAMN